MTPPGRVRGGSAQVEAIRGIHANACNRARRPREPGTGAYAVQPSPRMAVLTGDFNMPPADPAKRRISEPVADGAPRLLDSWQVLNGDARHPDSFCIADQTFGQPRCCDYVFVTECLAPRVEAVAYDVDTRLSDHQPIVLTLGGSGVP